MYEWSSSLSGPYDNGDKQSQLVFDYSKTTVTITALNIIVICDWVELSEKDAVKSR